MTTETTERATRTALDRFRVIAHDDIEFHVDRSGWPVELCRRCGGTGRYSYCQMYGDMCFGCSGKGVTLAGGKVADIVAGYRDAIARQRMKSGHDLAVGDQVRGQHAPKDAPWRTVVAVEDTGRECGRARTGSDPWIVYTYKLVTFDDGETVETGSIGWHGRVTVDRAPYVERAQAAYVAKLRRSR